MQNNRIPLPSTIEMAHIRAIVALMRCVLAGDAKGIISPEERARRIQIIHSKIRRLPKSSARDRLLTRLLMIA